MITTVIRNVSEALKIIHDNGSIHADIKPQNILYNPREQIAVLIDYGLGPIIQQKQTLNPDHIYGTIPYLSPEQAKGKPVTNQSDIYSFAITIYELIAGTNIMGHEQNPLDIQYINFHAYNDEIHLSDSKRYEKFHQACTLMNINTDELVRILSSASKKDHNQRTQDISLFAQELLKVFQANTPLTALEKREY